jgi:uncharacterized protein YjbI with pentapeptide repeats
MPVPEPIPDLLKAANDASGKAFALWVTFLTVGIYLAISIGTTTQLQLLRAGPVQLPLLGVGLPLLAFYGFAPPMFVVLHLYVLMQLYLLSRLLRLFDARLRNARMHEGVRIAARGQLDKFVFTQLLVGAPGDKAVRFFLWAVVWLSFVFGPILLLIGFQLRFLPYHSNLVTWVHRVALLSDLVLLFVLWPKISRRSGSVERTLKRALLATPVVLCGTAVLLFCVLLATFPGEPVTVDTGLRLPWLSRNIYLLGEHPFDFDEDKLSKVSVTLRLRERDLRESHLVSSDLRKTDFAYADLSSAILIGAKLSGADLIGANLTLAKLCSVDLASADLYNADLTNANLTGANLTNAKLREVDLTFAKLSLAKLDNADLSKAKLFGSKLGLADLSGANLGNAMLREVDLTLAKLDNADLSGADLSHVLRNTIPPVTDCDGNETFLDVDLSGTELQHTLQKQLDTACGDNNTKLPPGMTIKPCSPKQGVSPH